ncbi:MAG: glucosaminidase domain-containing protein [Marivibrio sp.]|uniref:glucosaminidase domain-containing protein n=1 Tax=Marivibrio sp. TaxID=2039719 RepID=UPI0032EF8766
MSRYAAFLRGFRSFSLKVRLIGAGLGLAALLTLAWGGFLVYENAATGGVGYVQPGDFALPDDVEVAEKKRIFFAALRPVVLAENARLAGLRAEVLAAREANDPSRVREIAARFGIETWPDAGWEALLRRVDTIPPALALAQAASESNWGQSRFAQEGANFFGQ